MTEEIEFKTKYSILPVKQDLVGTLNSFLKELLQNKLLTGIIIPNKLPNGSNYIPALVTDPEQLNSTNPLAPIMPVNASKSVMDLTRLTPSKKPVGAVLKPCEIRALVELVKLKQANLDNLLIIGIDCPGTISVKDFLNNTQNTTNKSGKYKNNHFDVNGLYEIFSKHKEHPELRSACRCCENFVPKVADVIIGLYGLDVKSQVLISIQTQLGFDIFGKLDLKFDDGTEKIQKLRSEAINDLRGSRTGFANELIKTTEESIKGLDNFMSVLSPCINCHNCMTVCPICYCKECFFESPTFDLESEKYFQLAEHKGAVRLPANMFLFHVTRFNHMVLSCVACGMCEQGCPVEIPLLSIYKTVGKNAQKVFDYEPGRSLDEEIPILTFKEDELEPK